MYKIRYDTHDPMAKNTWARNTWPARNNNMDQSWRKITYANRLHRDKPEIQKLRPTDTYRAKLEMKRGETKTTCVRKNDTKTPLQKHYHYRSPVAAGTELNYKIKHGRTTRTTRQPHTWKTNKYTIPAWQSDNWKLELCQNHDPPSATKSIPRYKTKQRNPNMGKKRILIRQGRRKTDIQN